MTKAQSQGTCYLCERTVAKSSVSNHLKACRKQHPPDDEKTRKVRAFHIVVEGEFAPTYWMHIEAGGDATLEDLDDLLRGTWLECCGHLSAFRIGESSYVSSGPQDVDEKGMDVALERVLRRGALIRYDYDFGSTTTLRVRMVSEYEAELPRHAVSILARNNPPDIRCTECGAPAMVVCTECRSDTGGWLCRKCSTKHECGEEMTLPVVNSPRVGECAYTGQDD